MTSFRKCDVPENFVKLLSLSEYLQNFKEVYYERIMWCRLQ